MTEKMKPSGIAWISDVPESWNLLKLKYFSYLKGRIGWQGLTADEFIDEGPYLITGTDFENGRIQFDRSYHISEARYAQAPEIQLQIGDLLVTKDGTVGKMAYVDELPGKASLNSHLLLIRPLEGKYHNRFLFWLMSSSVFTGYTEYSQDGTIMASLSQEKIGNFIAYFPDLDEQCAIADVLDAQCAKIDSVIADIEKQIEILQKYKKSLITEAVTKGLDRSVPMKNSGIEWAQHIPAHWQTTRMQEIGRYKKGPFGSAITLDMFIEKDETAVKIYEQKNAIQADATLGWYYISERDFAALTDFEVFPGDIIVSCAGTIGKCYIMPETMEKGIINQALMKITLSSNVDRNYFLSLFDVALEYMADKYSNGSAIKNIPPFSVLKKQHIPLPSIEEQKEIASYISQKSELLDRLIEEKKQQLQVMQDHKKSLIYEYVTGKKRVTEVN